MRQTRVIFAAVFAALVLVLVGFAVSGQPYPGQRLPLSYADLPDPGQLTGVWDLEPHQAGIADMSPFIPVENPDGISASYIVVDPAQEQALFAVTFGLQNGPEKNWMVAGETPEGIWDLAIDGRRGKAIIWGIGGNRWIGVAVWALRGELPADTDVVLAGLQEANA